MNKRDFFKLNRQKLATSRGTEDIAGRRLPREVYSFLPRKPFRPRPNKAALRAEADKAVAEWQCRSCLPSPSKP